MLVDLHVHTSISSPCSQIDPRHLVRAAADIGLDAVCVTEHEELEGAEVARRLGEEAGFPVFRGVEVYTELGDMLVFGACRARYPVTTPFAELLEEVRRGGGVIIPCHPCRGSLGFHHALGEERAEFLLANVDAIEVRNGGSSPESNLAAEAYAAHYGLPGVGGSDAHFIMQLGRCLTVFEREIGSEEELAEEIRAGRCRAAYAHEIEGVRTSAAISASRSLNPCPGGTSAAASASPRESRKGRRFFVRRPARAVPRDRRRGTCPRAAPRPAPPRWRSPARRR